MRLLFWGGASPLVAALTSVALPTQAYDLPPPPPTVQGVCRNCGSSTLHGTSGPTLEQQRQAREAKDLREAADDAYDKAVEAYENGNYELAEKLLIEAQEYAPEDETIRSALQKARESIAARQATSVQTHSAAAAAASDKFEAAKGFDSPGGRGSAIRTPVYAGGGSGGSASLSPAVLEKMRGSRATKQLLDNEVRARATLNRAISEVREKEAAIARTTDPAEKGRRQVDLVRARQAETNAKSAARVAAIKVEQAAKVIEEEVILVKPTNR